MRCRVRQRAASQREGFTLVEAVAALVVVGLGATAALAAVGSTLRTDGRVEHALAAEALGVQRLATLRLLPREQLLRLPDSLARGAFAAPLDEYHWRASSTMVPDAPDLFTVAVVVEWDGGRRALETRHFSPRLALQGR